MNLCVYILECQGFYKIGKSGHLKHRLNQMQIANPYKLNLIHTIPTDDHTKVERALHIIFADNQLSGEWYKLDQNDIADIKAFSVQDILSRARNIIHPTGKPNRLMVDLFSGIQFQSDIPIAIPEKIVVPYVVFEDAYSTAKPQRALLASFIRLSSLAWKSGYRYTPELNEKALMKYLKLSRRQYFEQKTTMEQLGWISSKRPAAGIVEFMFLHTVQIGEG